MKIKFKYKNLDAPNKNGHLYTKECIDKLFESKEYKFSQKYDQLFLLKNLNGVRECGGIRVTDIVGIVNLTNNYPDIVGEVTMLDVTATEEYLNNNWKDLYCCMWANCDDMEFEDDVELIKNMNIKCFYLSNTCAFDYEQEIIGESDENG